MSLRKDKIEEITSLRKKGHSLPEISSLLRISKGSVFKYIQGVEVLEEYKTQWAGKRGGSIKRMNAAWEKARKDAKEIVVGQNNQLMILATLYWCEGSKKDFNFMNSDPEMISLFVNLLRTELGIPTDKIRLSIRVFQTQNENFLKKYWSELLNVPLSNFASSEKVTGSKQNKIIHGMCRVRVLKGGLLLKYLTAVYKEMAVQLSSPHSSTDRARVS